jgi:phosphatidate cytidylyltransferase
MAHPDPYGRSSAPGEPGGGNQRARHTHAAPDAYPTHEYPTTDRPPRPHNGRGYPNGYAEHGRHAVEEYWPDHRSHPEPGGWPSVAQPEPDPVRPRRPGPGRRRATGRAGRNLPAAIGVGVGLGGIILASLFLYDRKPFLGVLAVAVAVGVAETGRAMRGIGARPPLTPLVGGGVLMVGLAWFVGADALSLGLLVTVLAAMVWRLSDGPAGYQRDVTASALIAVYVPFLAGFAALLAVPDDGAWRILVTLAAVVLSDTGGYAFGVFLGRHPMAPSVSPKKSWEGFAGSVLSAAIGGALLLYFLFDVDPWWGAVFGAAVSVAAVLGDLAESMIKRDLGVKDMSNLLPGHGGLMDRFDSILFALPTAYLLLSLFAPARSS